MPAFQHRIKAWLQSLPPDTVLDRVLRHRTEEDLMAFGAIPVLGRAGDLVRAPLPPLLSSSSTAHASYMWTIYLYSTNDFAAMPVR